MLFSSSIWKLHFLIIIYPLDKQNTKKPNQLIFFVNTSVNFFQEITILFWVLVFGFMYLVSVDPIVWMDRSLLQCVIKYLVSTLRVYQPSRMTYVSHPYLISTMAVVPLIIIKKWKCEKFWRVSCLTKLCAVGIFAGNMIYKVKTAVTQKKFLLGKAM